MKNHNNAFHLQMLSQSLKIYPMKAFFSCKLLSFSSVTIINLNSKMERHGTFTQSQILGRQNAKGWTAPKFLYMTLFHSLIIILHSHRWPWLQKNTFSVNSLSTQFGICWKFNRLLSPCSCSSGWLNISSSAFRDGWKGEHLSKCLRQKVETCLPLQPRTGVTAMRKLHTSQEDITWMGKRSKTNNDGPKIRSCHHCFINKKLFNKTSVSKRFMYSCFTGAWNGIERWY